MNKITLHVNSLCHTDKLGMEIELPEHPDLCEAIMTINKYCSEEVERKEKSDKTELFIAKKYAEIKRLAREGSSHEIVSTMLSVMNYQRDKKIEL